jgi:2-polyprenyl-3-methyl-5-hydroxy-6-metoxy-1,4-benzoquinol methylase
MVRRELCQSLPHPWRSLAATVLRTALTRSSCFERHCERLRARRCNPSAELKRLREIDDYMRPTTETRIARLGIAPGWKCLDVGAGAGGVARWMAEKVGTTGSVTATDIAQK